MKSVWNKGLGIKLFLICMVAMVFTNAKIVQIYVLINC